MVFDLVLSSTIGLVVTIILPVILDGLERKIKASIQSRIGPPITQTLYDLLKLFEKETKSLHTMPFIVFNVVSLVITLLVSAVLMHIYTVLGSFTLQAIAISLFITSLTFMTLTPLLVPNPFAYIGGMREVILAVINESAFILSYIIVISLLESSVRNSITTLSLILALITLLISSYALTGRVPFDIAEAEPELASGILVEFSGKLLAVYLFSILLKRYLVKYIIVSTLLVAVFSSGIYTLGYSILLTILLWIIYAVIALVLGRSRVDLAPRSLAIIYIPLLSLSITGLLVGIYVYG